MAITTYNFSGGASSASGVTTVATGNSAGKVIPAGTLIIVCFTSDSISTTAPTLSISTVGGGTPVATHGAPITSGASASAGAGIWHQCWRVVTTADLPTGGTIVTVTTNQAAAKTIACMGWSGVANTLRGTVATATSTTGVPTVANTGTVPQIGDLVVGCVSAENGSAVPGIDADTLNGVWFSNGVANGTAGAAGINCAVEYKRVNGPGAQTFNPPTLGGADSVICLYALAPLDSAVTQAAYRFYADDGSESASTALAAQDTAASADLTAGNVSLSVRLREQSTNVTDGLAADDWQLRWERNASGNWFDVANDLLLDTYADSNLDTNTALFTAGNIVGQTFQGDGKKLSRAGFVLKRIGTAAANVTAVLYAHSGTFGSGGVGTGAVLATSTTAKAVSSLSLFSQWEYFDFDGTFTLASGTSYVIGLTVSATTDSANCAWFGSDFSSPSHAGNGVNFTLAGSVWAAQSDDRIFRVNGTDPAAPLVAVPFNSANLTDGAATTSRLTGGTGTFVAGKVSEDGLADDILLTGRNYTELLYAVTLVKAWLSNGDTVRFRVVRVGSPTTPTFTQTPTVNVTVTSGFTGTATLSGDGSLGTAQTPGPTQTAALSGSGSLTTSATVTAVGAATLSGAGTLSAVPAPGPKQTAALSGDGTLTAAGVQGVAVAVALSGSGTLAAAGAPKPAVSAALSGSGSLSTAATVTVVGAATLTGSGTLATTQVVGPKQTVALSGDGSLSAAGQPKPSVSAALSGSGSLAATGVADFGVPIASVTSQLFVNGVAFGSPVTHVLSNSTSNVYAEFTVPGLTLAQLQSGTLTVRHVVTRTSSTTSATVFVDSVELLADYKTTVPPGTGAFTGTATLTGDGSLTTVQAPRPTVTAALSGDGSLTTTQVPRPTGVATLSGSGSLTTAQVPRPAVTVSLSGDGALSTAQVPRPAAAAALSGDGTLATTQVPRPAVSAALSGAGTLSTTQALTAATTATLSGSGSLSTTARVSLSAAATLSGSGTLSTTQSLTQAATATLSGSGTLTAVGTPLATAAGTATLSGSGTLATTQVPRPTGVATLSGDGSLTTAQTPRIAATATLSGSGTLAAVGAAFGNFVGFATLTGDGTLSTAQVPRFPVSAALSGSGSLTTAQVVRFTGTATLSGSGTLTSTQVSGIARTATLSGSGTLTTAQVPRPAPTAALSGSGTLTTAGVPRIAAAATLSGDGTLSTAQVVRVSGTAVLSGSGTLSTTAAPSVARSAALSGSGALTVVTSLGAVRAVSLSGSGTLATTQSLSVTGFAALTGSGTLAYAAAVMAQATAALSGTGNLTVETSATGALVEFVGVIPI